jgi:hypothetical protein
MLRIMLIALICTACEPVVHYFGMQDDSLTEELIEGAIKYETGAEIDLTPSSPEK